jgi:hypothetical protein
MNVEFPSSCSIKANAFIRPTVISVNISTPDNIFPVRPLSNNPKTLKLNMFTFLNSLLSRKVKNNSLLVKDFSYLTDMAYIGSESQTNIRTKATEKIVLEHEAFSEKHTGSGFKIPSKVRWPRSPADGQNVTKFIWVLRFFVGLRFAL